MSDLFMPSWKSSREGMTGTADQDCKMWAERLMRDVNEEVSREERKERDFIQAWIRWTDLVRLVNFLDLAVYRNDQPGAEDLKWHRMLTSGLVGLGGALEQWAKSFSKETLALASYDPDKLEAMVQSVQSSFEDFHSQKDQRLSDEIAKFLPR